MQALIPAAGGVVLDGLNLTLVLVVLVISLIALVMGALFRGQVLAADPGTPKMQEIGAALAGEMSGHLFFAHRYLGYDDAIYAAARLIELLSDDPRPQALAAQVDTLPRLHRTPEIRIPVADAAKEALVQHAAAILRRTPGVEISELDGIRIHWPDAWALLRASNTQAALVLRFEATHAKRLSEVRTQVERVLMQSQAALSLTPSPLTPSDEPKR
jgi:phosphomannomutase